LLINIFQPVVNLNVERLDWEGTSLLVAGKPKGNRAGTKRMKQMSKHHIWNEYEAILITKSQRNKKDVKNQFIAHKKGA
jgi:hypothetical protein